MSLTAQSGDDGAEITRWILVDGRVISEQTSSGLYAVASCSGDADGE
ncbi:hypothetical protein [Nocardia sp. NPDC057353]